MSKREARGKTRKRTTSEYKKKATKETYEKF